MKLFEQIKVADECVGLMYENERFQRVLEPGIYWLKPWLRAQRVEQHWTGFSAGNSVDETVLRLADRAGEPVERLLQRWKTGASQVGLVYHDGALVDVLEPATRGAFWQGEQPTEVRLVDIAASGEVDAELARVLRGARSAQLRSAVSRAIVTLTVPEGHVGFLQIDGKRQRVLAPGVHVYWNFDRDISGQMVDCRLQNMEVNGQEILTADKVALRVNLSATWRVSDAERVLESLADHADFLYRELQLALRTVVSTRSLDELLEDKNQLNAEVQALVRERAVEYGLSVSSVGARDIVLPGEMKVILAQVVEARKRAEANLILRREETQATRSLHNTAKVMEGNATLLRLKELEVLEKVSARIGTMNVYGGLNGVMKDLVTLTDSAVEPK